MFAALAVQFQHKVTTDELHLFTKWRQWNQSGINNSLDYLAQWYTEDIIEYTYGNNLSSSSSNQLQSFNYI